MNEQEKNKLRDIAIARYKKIHEQPVSDALVNGILRGGLAGGITGATLASVPATVMMINHDSYKNQEFNAKDHAKCVLLSALLGGAGGSLVGGLIGGGSAIAKKENAAYQLSKLVPKTAAAKDYLIGGLAGAGIGAGGGMLANLVLGKKLTSAPLLLTGAGLGGAMGLAVGHQQAKFRAAEDVSNYVTPIMTRKDKDGRDEYYVTVPGKTEGQSESKHLEYGSDGCMYVDGKKYTTQDKDAFGDPIESTKREVRWDKDNGDLYTVRKDESGKETRERFTGAFKRFNKGVYVVATREVPISEALGKPSNPALDNSVPGFRNIFTHAACVAVSDKPFSVKTPGPNGLIERHALRGQNGQYFMEFGLTAHPDEKIKYTGLKKMLMPKFTGPYINHEIIYPRVEPGNNPFNPTPELQESVWNNPVHSSAGMNAMQALANRTATPALQVMSISDPASNMDDKVFTHIMDRLSTHIQKHPDGYNPYNVATKPWSYLLAEGNPYSNCHEWIVGFLHGLYKDKTIPKGSLKYIASTPFPALAGNFQTSERGYNTYFKGDED